MQNPSRRHAHDLTEKPLLLGSALFLPTIPAHLLVTHSISADLAAITLALIAGAYIGFAAADGRQKVLVTELAVGVLFGLAALAGLVWQVLFIPAALALHALWDILHHEGRIGARVPFWYIPLCVVFDLASALFLFVLYLV